MAGEFISPKNWPPKVMIFAGSNGSCKTTIHVAKTVGVYFFLIAAIFD